MLDKNFIPQKPFPNFKWKWASFAPTESINDPVVLLGVLFRMEKLEGKYAFSSKEFEKEMEGALSFKKRLDKVLAKAKSENKKPVGIKITTRSTDDDDIIRDFIKSLR